MLNNYEDSLNRLLKDEGGYTNNPSDPGGPTNFGITIADYKKYINPNGTVADVKGMKLSDAKSIYKSKYWDALNCSALPSGVDYAVFDYGVNSGVGRANKVLIKFKDIQDPSKLINAICDERMAFLKGLKTWPVFGKGWTRRVEGVRQHSLELAKKSIEVKPATSAGAGVAGTLIATGAAATVAAQAGYHWGYIVAGLVVAGFIALLLIHNHLKGKTS